MIEVLVFAVVAWVVAAGVVVAWFRAAARRRARRHFAELTEAVRKCQEVDPVSGGPVAQLGPVVLPPRLDTGRLDVVRVVVPPSGLVRVVAVPGVARESVAWRRYVAVQGAALRERRVMARSS